MHIRITFFSLLAMFTLAVSTRAQHGYPFRTGDFVLNVGMGVLISQSTLVVETQNTFSSFGLLSDFDYHSPASIDIAAVCSLGNTFLVGLSDGSFDQIIPGPSQTTFIRPKSFTLGQGIHIYAVAVIPIDGRSHVPLRFQRATANRDNGGYATPASAGFGDVVYTLTSSDVQISRDSASTWQIDTAGFGGPLAPNAITSDTLRYAYLATTVGLFKQHADSATWKLLSSFPAAYVSSVYGDRKNRLFASSGGIAYLSTNGGTSWTKDTAGMGLRSVSKFGDDALGNVYAIAGKMIFRSTTGTQPWVRIDQALTALFKSQLLFAPFNSVHGDTTLYAATAYGLFKSTDQGTTWSDNNRGIFSESIAGIVKTTSGKMIAGNAVGVFAQNPGDTVWNKIFPTDGYLPASPVWIDNAGALYTAGAGQDPTNFQSLPTNWKSTDNGTSWSPDTAGLGALGVGQAAKLFADEQGNQYLSAFGGTANIFSKRAGQSWSMDTTGYGRRANDQILLFASDKKGAVYASFVDYMTGIGTLWKRPITGGSWTPDTTGLAGSSVYSFVTDRSGVAIVGTYNNGVFKKSGSTWVRVPTPSSLGITPSAFVLSVDSSGALFAGFTNGISPWLGAYFTTNGGISWTYAGMNGVPIRNLTSYGDTTFAGTYYNGISVLTRSTPTGVEQRAGLPTTIALAQNYPNPFNPTTAISFQLSAVSKVSMKVYNLLGQEVETLVEGEMTAGTHRVTFDGSNLASGIYFYRLKAGDFTATKKLVLIK